MIGYFSTEELLILEWDVSQKFSEKKTYLDIVSQIQISCDFSTSFDCSKVKETFRRFQLEAPKAYESKQILGVCQKHLKMLKKQRIGPYNRIMQYSKKSSEK